MGLKIDESRKRKLGFKKNPEELRRTVSLAFTPLEFKQLDAVADQYELSRSEFVRCVIFGGLDKVAKKIELKHITEHNKKLLVALDRIGNNLNQIGRHLNFDQKTKLNLDDLMAQLEEFKESLQG